MQANFINVGSSDMNWSAQAENKDITLDWLFNQVKSQGALGSNNIDFLEYKDTPNKYGIFVGGCRQVGDVQVVETITYRCTDCKSESEISVEIHNDESRYVECACGERCVQFMTWDEYKLAVANELHKQAKWPMSQCVDYAESFDCTYKDIIKDNDMPCPADDVSEELTAMCD